MKNAGHTGAAWAGVLLTLATALHATAESAESLDGALHDCRVPGIRNTVSCAAIERPLDPARPDRVKIQIHYVVAPALARNKLADPVFLLAGGPGQSAIALAPSLLPLLARINNRRDIVFVDQRGTGRSAPLDCGDPSRESLAEQADPEAQFKRLMSCESALEKLPYGDLRDFTTPIAMQDLEAVRRQLGAERINLIGASYGTRAALDYQRQFPQAVRRSVIDGVAPPDMALPASFSTDGQAAFDALLAGCRSEPACAADHPTLGADWKRLLQRLPEPVTVAHPLTGAPERFTLTREMVLAAVRGPLYAPALAAALPVAISNAARGRFESLMGINALLISRKATQPAMGMHFSVVCAEDLPRLGLTADAPGADFGVDGAALYRRVCAHWPRGEVPPAFYAVPRSRSPVLLFSGGLDPATPPRHAARMAGALGPLARHVVVANAGHGVMSLGCARDVIFRFIDADADSAAIQVDATCLESIPRPPAFQPVELGKPGEVRSGSPPR